MLGDGVLEDIDDGAGQVASGGAWSAHPHVEGDLRVGSPMSRRHISRFRTNLKTKILCIRKDE